MYDLLSSEKLIESSWIFIPLDKTLGRNKLRFGPNGRIEIHSNPNEDSWRLKDNILEIFRNDGLVMWKSTNIIVSNDGIEIFLDSSLQSSMHSLLRECANFNNLTSIQAAPLTAARFLFPDDLRLTPTSISKVLLVGSCMSQMYLEPVSL